MYIQETVLYHDLDKIAAMLIRSFFFKESEEYGWYVKGSIDCFSVPFGSFSLATGDKVVPHILNLTHNM